VVPSPKSPRAHRPITPQESYAAELQLLQRAQSEYASQDFDNALVLVAEHGRRFPNGRLAEEREALRVRSLARAGRGDEARRALAAFANRFPHSVFLPRLQEAARSAED
jgi:outer membrane protein assembly factor BamD (BamD/ComL family)